MKKILAVSFCMCLVSSVVLADTFGTGANQFTIDFVPISGDASSVNGTYIGYNKPEGFTDPANDYRMGKYEITNDQWTKFKAAYGTVAGNPSNSYDQDPYWAGSSIPTNNVSWYEAAQFVNWLNTSNGKSAAYKFTDTQGTSGYTLGVWSASDAGYNAANPYRNSNAIYYLPTENEWVKAAYWNGTTLQKYATKAGESLYQGNGSNGGWNYIGGAYSAPWNVGCGSQELNGTYDMMGNVWEWMEGPYYTGDYLSGSARGLRGGSYTPDLPGDPLASYYRYDYNPFIEYDRFGFRVASIPEPASLLLLVLGGLLIRYKK